MTRLGPREKRILLAMLEFDDPPGSPTPWGFLFPWLVDEDYKDMLPKATHGIYREERNYKKAITRLTKINLVKVDVPKPPPKNVGYQFYRLMPAGRRLAEEIRRKERLPDEKESQDDVEKAIQLLIAQGYKYTTFDQIHETLWRISHDKFGDNREEFKKYWTKQRLGWELKKVVSKRTHISKRDGRKKYFLV